MKVKIKNKPDKELDKLYDLRRVLRSQNTPNSKKELDQVEKQLAEKYSEKMYNIIKEEIANVDSEDGGFNSGKLWRLKKKTGTSEIRPTNSYDKHRRKVINIR